MKPKNLVEVVSKIKRKKVSELQAMQFALKNYGELASYIRNEHTQKLLNS